MLGAAHPEPLFRRPGRALIAALAGLTAVSAVALLPLQPRARREAAPAGNVALCGLGETCRTVGCHFTFPFGSPTLSWSLRQEVPDAVLPDYWVPGRALDLRLSVSDSEAFYIGFQLAAVLDCPFAVNGGELELLEPARTSLVIDDFERAFLTHSCTCLDVHACCGFVPEVLGSGELSWTFRWTPPPRGSGPVVFHFAFNSANGDGTEDNDRISIAELIFEEEPCPPPIEDLRVRKAACDPALPGQWRAEIHRLGGEAIDILREAADPAELAIPPAQWAGVDTCRPLLDGRRLVVWSAAPVCDLGGEGSH